VKQTHTESFLESTVNTILGNIIGFILNASILPMFGFQISGKQNIILLIIFSIVGLIRGYLIRRLFERLRSNDLGQSFYKKVIAICIKFAKIPICRS
jgi:uncharacterized protein YacL